MSPIGNNTCGVLSFVIAIIAATHSSASQADPFLSRDQNPFTMIYGQPMPTSAWLPEPAAPRYYVSLDIANTLNAEDTGNEKLLVDFEGYHLTFGGMEALNKDWALRLDLSFIYRSGGVFDHAIDEWHKLFGLPRAFRPLVPDSNISIYYARADTINYGSNQSISGIADSQLGLGHQIYRGDKTAVSAWGSIDMPLGKRNELTGNNDLDYAFWLAGSTRLGDLSSIDTNFGVVFPGDSIFADLDTEDLVVFGHIGTHLALNQRIALKLQLTGHSGYYKDTTLDFLGSSWILVFGGSVRIGRCSAIDIGFGEDIDVGASPDASLLISWKSRLAC
ncbi:MAG: DUF3187 family protein [Gammaproteobacteria bacterium]|nr:DUF3187 family protein [Gammaproteobacteria bacterium]